MSTELQLLLNHFKLNCGVKVFDTIEEQPFFHWKRLVFSQLDTYEIKKISEYLIKFFGCDDNYPTPKLHSYLYYGKPVIVLTFDESEIEKFLNN